jgi:hypothetical protein
MPLYENTYWRQREELRSGRPVGGRSSFQLKITERIFLMPTAGTPELMETPLTKGLLTKVGTPAIEGTPTAAETPVMETPLTKGLLTRVGTPATAGT